MRFSDELRAGPWTCGRARQTRDIPRGRVKKMERVNIYIYIYIYVIMYVVYLLC